MRRELQGFSARLQEGRAASLAWDVAVEEFLADQVCHDCTYSPALCVGLHTCEVPMLQARSVGWGAW